jgi:hypothetical protein
MEHKFTLVSENITTLFSNLLRSHSEKELIQSCIPRGTGIGTPWILAILGRRRGYCTTGFVVPPLEELRRRISLSLNGALAKKRTHPATRLFSQDNGFLWQAVHDSFDVNRVYLDVCSEFPKRLEKLLQDSGKTLDRLAGV